MDGLSPEELELLLGTNGDPAQLEDLQQQIAQAQALRNYQPAPTTQAGRVVVANPAGAIAGMFLRGQGKKQEQAARDERADIMRRQARGNEAMLRALTDSPERRMRELGMRNGPPLQDFQFDPETMPQPRLY